MDLNSSLEALCEFSIFERQSAIRRTSDIASKFAETKDIVLPKNTMLHWLDNFGRESNATTDVPNIADYPLMQIKHLKYGNHSYDLSIFDKEDLDKFGSRFLRSGMMVNIRNWIKENRRSIIPVADIEQSIDNRNIILITNYNPLWRLIAINDRPINEYYRYQAILKTVLKNATKYDRQNFLLIPIPKGFTYDRTNFLSMITTGKISAQKLISTNHFYFFMLDLVAFLLDNNSKISTLNSIPLRQLGMLNIILSAGDKVITFNLGKLAALVDNKTRVFNFVNHVTNLAPRDPSENYEPLVIEDEQGVETESTDLSKDNNKIQDIKIRPEIKGLNKTSRLIPSILDDKSFPELDEDDDEDRELDKLEDQLEEETNDKSDEQEESDIIIENPDELPEIDPLTYDFEKDESETSEQTFLDRGELSPKQIEQAKIVSERWKKIIIRDTNGKQKTLSEIVDAPIDSKVPSKSINLPEGDLIDSSMLKSSVKEYDRLYQENLLQKDVISNLVAFKEVGLYLTNFEEVEESNSHTRVRNYRAQFQDAKNKRHTVKFKIPVPDSEGYYLVDGVKLSMSKQLVNVPICKISPTRVSLISNYNKTLVDKVGSTRNSLPDYISKNASDLGISFVPKNNRYIGIKAPYEYRLLGSFFSKLTTKEIELFFEYPIRYQHFGLDDKVSSLESKYGVLCGRSLKSKDEFLFIDDNNSIIKVDIKTGRIESERESIVSKLGDIKVPAEWCELKILDRNLPIIFILGFRYGLRNILRLLKIRSRFYSGKQKADIGPTDISIQFRDGKLVINRYPLLNSYIVSGLLAFSSLKKYTLNELDDRDTYYHLLTDKGLSTNYLKGIDNHFDFFIDPITKEVLEEMKEPTNTRDLLIRAVEMLIYDTDQSPSSLKNFRLRSAEKIPGVIYNEISRQYANYVNSNYKDVTFSINTEAVYQRILQDQTMVLREDLNPIGAIKESARVTYAGFGGRTPDAFVERDRRYPKDAIGILGETTTDSGSVGMVAALTGDPKLKNLRGMFDLEHPDLDVTNILSDTSLLLPGITHDDQQLQIVYERI